MNDGSRRRYLLDGRRVTVADLLGAGLIDVGDRLIFVRPRSGQTHVAVVAESGSLLVDGHPYATPSAAARAVISAGQIDGWMAWTTDAGTTLHGLRARLLDDVAVEATTGELGDDEEDQPAPLLPRHEFLKQARVAVERGEPKKITVRDLLRLWGGRTRGSRISLRIEADLDNHALTTDPDFLSVSLDDEVILAAVQPEPMVAGAADGVTVGDSATPADSASATESVREASFPADSVRRREIGMTLGNLTVPWRRLEWVKPTATIAEAMTKMLVNDFSQLPVLRNKYALQGAVTWQSIARARLKGKDALLSNAIVEAEVMSYGQDLHEVLPRLEEKDFVVVANHHNEITGIVTTADVVALYRERTQPFLLIGELDQELRQIMEKLDLDRVRAVCARPGQPELASVDDMTMGDYQRVLEHPDCWDALGWPLDRGTLVKRIEELRKIRNDITHFNPDPVPNDAVDKLRHMLDVIRMFAPSENS